MSKYIVEHTEEGFTNEHVERAENRGLLRYWMEVLRADFETLDLHQEKAERKNDEEWAGRIKAKRKLYNFLLHKIKARLIVLGNSFARDFYETARRDLEYEEFEDIRARTEAERKARRQ